MLRRNSFSYFKNNRSRYLSKPNNYKFPLSQLTNASVFAPVSAGPHVSRYSSAVVLRHQPNAEPLLLDSNNVTRCSLIQIVIPDGEGGPASSGASAGVVFDWLVGGMG